MRLPWIVALTFALLLPACASSRRNSPLPPSTASRSDWIRDIGIVPMDLAQMDPLAYSTRVRKIIQPKGRHVRKCYKKALKTSPRLYGEMQIVLEIGPEGDLLKSFVQYTDIPDLDLEDCILELYEEIDFPTHTETLQQVMYPYVFTAAGTPKEVRKTLKRLHRLRDPKEQEDAQERQEDEFAAPW